MLGGVSLELRSGDFVAFVGPNGCGKSTILNIISGLSDGNHSCDQMAINVPSHQVSYMFQSSRSLLLPWRTGFGNLSFPLELQGVSAPEANSRIRALAGMFRFDELDKYPYELSGGQAQKLVFMRSLINLPRVLLLDEPFSAIDYENSLLLRRMVQDYFIRRDIVILIVTHNIEEAVHLANKIIVLSDKPSEVAAVINNPAPYPRSLEFLQSVQFHRLKEKVLSAFQKEAGLAC